MPTLFVSTPCYGGICLEKYATSIIRLQELCLAKGVEMFFDTIENESLVQRARNVSIGRFMQKTNADYFMFIDADIHFDPESVLHLLGSGHDISVACYPKKFVDWDTAAKYVKNGGDTSKCMTNISSSLVVNVEPQESEIHAVDAKGFMKIMDGPTGFMMIKREVIQRMEGHYPELWCVNDHQNRDMETYCALFDCMIDPDTRRYLSEDYAFCRRWQLMGGSIHAHISSTLGHVGNLAFEGKFCHRLKETKT